MLKERIKFKDFEDRDREMDFYFHLSESELSEMEMSKNGGLTKLLKRIIDEDDMEKLAGYFKDLILKSYGIKSNDGLRFEKSEEISRNFSHTNAYNMLYMSLIKDADKAAAFVNGIVPKELRASASTEIGEAGAVGRTN